MYAGVSVNVRFVSFRFVSFRLRRMGPHGGGGGQQAEEPGRVERASVESWEGMRRSEKAKVSEEAARRRGGGGGPMERRMG